MDVSNQMTTPYQQSKPLDLLKGLIRRTAMAEVASRKHAGSSEAKADPSTDEETDFTLNQSPPVRALGDIASQLSAVENLTEMNNEKTARRPVVVILEANPDELEEVANSESSNSVVSSAPIEKSPTPLANEFETDASRTWAYVSQFAGSSEESKRTDDSHRLNFAVDPYSFGDSDSIPVMSTIPVIDSQEADSHQQPYSSWAVVESGDGQELASNFSPIDATNSGSDGNLFYVAAGEVIFIDGSLGFDHIDLRCFSVENATFQNNTIIVNAQSNAPITIRFRSIRYAVFSGEVLVDL